VIRRDPAAAADVEHDLVIVGGGVYGACVALEAAQRGLRPLLLERGDFGEATSWNSLRIVHGGLRYLQTGDLRRFRESVAERSWFLRTFPELVRPLECLMPLYGDGLRRPSVFAAALRANDLLSYRRNAGLDPEHCIGEGRVLGAEETVERFPLVDRAGLRGAGLWHDAVMASSQRVLIEVLHWACSLGATALNYVEATALLRRGAGIEAVEARDVSDGRTYTFAARSVCNAAGPWSPVVARRFGAEAPHLFRPSLAFNVLIDREPVCSAAVAVSPRHRAEKGTTWFVYPAFGRLLAGTVHAPWTGDTERPEPTESDLQQFLSDLNAAIPGLDVRRDDVLRVFAGLLPATRSGTARLSVRPVIVDHEREGGPRKLVSVSGVKFTTARLVAERTLDVLGPRLGRLRARRGERRPPRVGGLDFTQGPETFGPDTVASLRELAETESVVTIDDLLFRRTNWAVAERDTEPLRARVAGALGWTGRSFTRQAI
jgi:glycerol-3-phosphate dehydrogenase